MKFAALPRTLSNSIRSMLRKNNTSANSSSGSESVEGFALSTGKNVLYFGKAGSVKETTERINAIAIDEIRDIAAGIADNLSTLIYL